MKRVLVFFPHNFWPPRTGAHKRCQELINGLRDSGCKVALASSKFSTEIPWTEESVAGLLDSGISQVSLHEPSPADLRFAKALRTYYQPDYLWLPVVRRLHPRGHREIPFNSKVYTPPGMRRWFSQVVDDFAPDFIVMNYAYWDGLIDHSKLKSVVRIIDILDLVSLNQRMQKAVQESLPYPLLIERVRDSVLREDFFERLTLSASAQEHEVYNNYDYTIAITALEVETIRRRSPRTKVVLVPMMLEPKFVANRYSDAALFPMGPNYFNTQGYLYFVKRVLPQVRKHIPSFSLRVTGFYQHFIPVDPIDGVALSGFVPDLGNLYEGARFLVCPVFGGTGQQIKIVEAMAYGVPVVALKAAAERSPLQHGVTGLVAENAEEFIEHTVRLWNDSALRRRLGNAARETIALEFSRDRITEGLAEMKILEN
jgi:glycosyltransferase involved in cell wall biosynthesis